ncbi:MAG: CHAT domain-containing tetratricopeptide repeat protein [Balneolaceae bacterium]
MFIKVRCALSLNKLKKHFFKTSILMVCTVFAFQLPLQAQPGLTAKEKFEEGKRLYHQNESRQAEDLFSEIIENLCGSRLLVEECVEAQLFLSVIKRNERDFESTEKILRSAESVINDRLHEEHVLNIDLYVQFAFLYEETGAFEDAGLWLEKAFELVEKPGVPGLPRARAYLALGFVEDTKGNYKAAVDAYNQALFAVENEPRGLELLKILSQAYNNIGIAYRRLGMVNQAMSHYQLALQVANEAYGSDHVELAFAYNSIGTIYYTKGDFGTAGDYFLQAAAIFEVNYGENNQRVAGAFNNAGLSFFQLEDYEQAAEYLEHAQKIKVSVLGEEHLETAIGYSNLGSIHLQNNNISAARSNYELSLEVRDKIYGGNHPNLVDPLLQLGRVHIKNGDRSTGRDYLDNAIQIALERLGENHPVVAEAYFEIGNSYREDENIERAEDYYNQVLRLMTGNSFNPSENSYETGSVSEPLLFVSTLKALAELHLDRYKNGGNLSGVHEAISYYQYASDVMDKLQTSYQSEASKLNLIEQNYSVYTGTIRALHILYRQTNDIDWLDEIFVIAEKSKSRIALELFQNVEAKNVGGVPEHILDEERELNTLVTNYYQQLHVEKEKGLEADEGIIKTYQDSLFYAQQRINRFTESLEKNYPSYYILKYDKKVAGKREAAELLSSNETLITYIMGENSLYAMVLCNGDISMHNLGESAGLTEQINEIKRAVVGGNTQLYREKARSLYSKLLEPLETSIHTKELVIIPDQILHYLPFEMLLTNSVEEAAYHELPYLIKKYQVKYAPSVAMLEIMNNQKPETPRNLLAMAPFYRGAVQGKDEMGIERYLMNLSPLALTRYETNEIGRMFTEKRSLRDYIFPEKAELLMDNQATRSRLMNTPLDEYGFIHFATHAFVHESNPDLSGIALSGDTQSSGIVYVSDIYNLQMNADLVVLGACETGLGSIYRGEGLIGFTRAFIYAGAANLVVSMWRVNDQPTSRLMINFYKNIREGMSYAESLQQAKLELINNPEMAAPRNWAAFILNGR